MSDEFDTPDPRFVSMYDGVVVDNQDPLRLGRVKVRVPGLLEPSSRWALPFGAPGGGSNTRGFYFPPEVGAEVQVMFKQGDTDHPRYTPGAWGVTDGEPDTPSFVRTDLETGEEISPENAVKVRGIETKNWQIVFDDREGVEILKIIDRNPDENSLGVVVELDGAKKGVRIAGTSAIQVECNGVIHVDGGLGLFLQGRKVRRGGGEI